LRERAYDTDLSGDGVVGDTVKARLDSTVRDDGFDLALFKTAAGSYFFVQPGADPAQAPSFPFAEADDGVVMRTARDALWSPQFDALNAEALALRSIAADEDGIATSVRVLIRTESDTGIVRHYEQDLGRVDGSAQMRALSDRWRSVDPADVEGLYLQDLNGDGVIDATPFSFATDHAPPPTGVTLSGERLIVTGEQVRYLTGGVDGDTPAGVRARLAEDAHAEGLLLPPSRPGDLGIVQASVVDPAFALNRAGDPLDADVLVARILGSGVERKFAFTVPGHALDEPTLVRVSGLADGATASLFTAGDLQTIVAVAGGDGEALSLGDGVLVAPGTHVLVVDTSAAATRAFDITLEQEVPSGWGREVTARFNVLQIEATIIEQDTDLRHVDPDHVTVLFNPGAGGAVAVAQGVTLTLHAEHAAGQTITGAGTVVLLGDLRGHDFSGIRAATVDFAQADTGLEDAAGELNFPTDAALWPPIDTDGILWVLRGGQADLVSRTEGLQIQGRKDGKPVGNIRIVDDVDGLDLSEIDVAYIDMSGATGTARELPQIGAERFLLLRADQADGLTGSLDGARLHLTSDSLGHLAETAVDFSALDLGKGLFTAIVTEDLAVDADADLGALQLTVLGTETTLTLTGVQADGRVINDAVSIWTRDQSRDEPQTGPAGQVVIVDPAAGINLSGLGLVTGIDEDGQPDGSTTRNDNPYVTLSVSRTTDFTANETFGDAPIAAVRGDGEQLPPALRIDAYDVAVDASMTITAAQASFRQATGLGEVVIDGLDAGTDLWGFQRGTSPTVAATVEQGAGFLDLRENASLNDALEAYDLGARDTRMTEAQASGRTVSGNDGTKLHVHGLEDDTDLSGVEAGLDVTGFLSGDVDIRGNDDVAAVDTFDLGGHRLEADTARLGETVEFVGGAADLYVAKDEVLTKSFTFTGTHTTLYLADGADIRGATLTGIDEIVLDAGASVFLTAAQASGLTVTGTGTVRVDGFDADTDLSGFAEGLTINATVTSARENLRDNGSVDRLASLELVGAGNDVLLTGAQASGLTITGPNGFAIWLKDMPSDADLSGVAGTIFVRVLLSGDADVSGAVNVLPVREYFLFGQTLTISAKQLYQFGQQPTVAAGGEGFHHANMDWSTDATGSRIIVSGVTDPNDLSFFIVTNYGVPDLVARIDAGSEVDLTANPSLGRVTAYEVEAGATLTLTAAQVSGIEVTGSGRLVVDALASDTDLSQVAPSLTLDVRVTQTVDVTQNATLGNVDAFDVLAGATLTLTAAQADGQIVTGAGNVVVTALGGSEADLSGITVDGSVALDAGNPNPVLGAEFTFGARGYEVIGAGTLDISAVADLSGVTGFGVAADSVLVATATQIEGLSLDAGAIGGTGSVVLTGVDGEADIDPAIFGPDLSVSAVLSGEVAFADLGWVTELRLDGASLTVTAGELGTLLQDFPIAGPGRLLVTGLSDTDTIDLLGLPEGITVALDGIGAGDSLTVLNRGDAVVTADGVVGLFSPGFGTFELGGEVTAGVRITATPQNVDAFNAAQGFKYLMMSVTFSDGQDDFGFTAYVDEEYLGAQFFPPDSSPHEPWFDIFDHDIEGASLAGYVDAVNLLLAGMAMQFGQEFGTVSYDAELNLITWDAAEGFTVSPGSMGADWGDLLFDLYTGAFWSTGDYVVLTADGEAVFPRTGQPAEDVDLFNARITTASKPAEFFSDISAALSQAQEGDTIIVGAGTYTETLSIDKGITLLSGDGADNTEIVRPEASNSLGTVLVAPGTEGVTIGGIGHGFTIQGGDSPAPGIEWAAVYFQGGGHKAHTVQGNTIVANGDSALMTEFNPSIEGLLIDSNLFTGQTFAGDDPATGNQFEVANVARQMVVIGGGEGVTNTKDVTFTNNTVEGASGANGKGNVGVTIDVVGGTIAGNTFAIDTGGGWPPALRVRGPDTDVTDNIFTGTNTGFSGTRTDATYTGNVFTGAAMGGTPGADRFEAGPADNIFFGGAGADSFVFAGESIGANVITDFEGAGVPGGDVIDLGGLGVRSLDDLSIDVQDGITEISGPFAGTITLLGVTATLIQEDFVFDTIV